MTSYKGLLNKIEAFCNAHLQIKKYGGEFKEQMPNFSTEDEKYPIIYVVPTSDLSDLNTNQFTLDVYCVDIIQKDRANINTIVSDCNLIVNDLYLYFLDGNDLSIDVIGASSGSPINNFDLDYSAGWVKSITFEVQAYSVCAIPMNPINPNPPQVCNPANYNLVDTLDNILSSGSIDSGATENIVVGNSTVENSDASYSASVLAEGSLVLPDITIDLVGTYGDTILTETIPSAINKTITVNDSIVSNSDASYYVELPATSSLNLPDITVNVVNSASTVVNTSIEPSVQDVTISAPDGTINIKKTGDGTISSQSVPSGATIDYSVADNAITVNSTNGFSIDATDPLNIVLTDGTSSVTPTSVTYSQGQHKVDIVLPANVPTYSSAELMKTGQTTSYTTNDDGDTEKGRSLTVLSSNNPFGNSNRFTDILGGSTYSNNWVLDWSTYNGSTVLGYVKNPHTLTGDSWANSMAFCTSYSLGGFSGCRNANELELRNIQSRTLTGWFNYSPFNIPNGFFFHTSNTLPENTALEIYCNYQNYLFQSFSKATNAGIKPFPVRNFTLAELGL